MINYQEINVVGASPLVSTKKKEINVVIIYLFL